MTEAPPQIEPPSFRDRSAGLKGFGIVQIVLGALCALLVPLMLLGVLLQPKTGAGAMPAVSLAMPVAIYGGLAVVLVWLGIGSIQAQRWARTLTMIFSWAAFVMGVFGTLGLYYFVLYLMPNLPGQPNSAAFRIMLLAFMTVFFGIFFIILPGCMAWFYTKKEVKATCEARHPNPSWTDGCPATVLLLALWVEQCGLLYLTLPFTYHGVIPLFGLLLTGFAGTTVCLILSGFMVVSGYLYYRLKPAGWWLMLALQLGLLIAGVLNALLQDTQKTFSALGYSPEQIERMKQYDFVHGATGVIFIFFCIVPFLGLLGWTARYFFPKVPAQA